MPELTSFENLTAARAAGLGLFWGLLAVSAGVWVVLIVRLWRGAAPCADAGSGRRTWSRGLSFAAAGIVIPLQILAWRNLGSPPAAEITLDHVRQACAVGLVQAVLLVGLPALIAPLRPTDVGWCWAKADLCCGLAAFIACWLPVTLVNAGVSLAGWRAPGGKHAWFRLLDSDSSASVVFWIALSVVVVAPLVEEILYRVVLQGWLEQHLPAWAAIAIVALAFSAAHYSPGRPDAVPLLPLALILGWLYHRRRSLPAAMLAHALFNASMLGLALCLR